MNKFVLSLTAEQVNVIFAALGKLPFESVFNLINEMNSQLGSQVQTQPPAPEEFVTKTLPDEE